MRLFGKRPPQKTTRLFFATDVHGSERTFRKFLNAGQYYEADVLILGGDILGQVAIPIIRDGGAATGPRCKAAPRPLRPRRRWNSSRGASVCWATTAR